MIENKELIKLLNGLKERSITSIDEAIKSLGQLWVPPKDTLISVWDTQGSKHRRYATGEIIDGMIRVYTNGKTSHTHNGTQSWNHWEPIPDAPSAFNWQENTGVIPDCSLVFVEFNDGIIDSNHPSRFLWFTEDSSRSIKQFVVLC